MFKNPLLRSSFILYTFWYWAAGLALVAIGRADLHEVLACFSASLALTAGGAIVGLYMTLGTEVVLMHMRMREVKAGHAHRGARLSLGKLPGSEVSDTKSPTPDTHQE